MELKRSRGKQQEMENCKEQQWSNQQGVDYKTEE
jgi:hypothetical protein